MCPHEAQEDDQINLVEGEYIYDVEPIDDGWWRGTTADGKRGLFPASYVEERAAPNEAEVPPPQRPVRPTSNSVTSSMQRSQQSQKKKKRKGKGGDDDSKFTNAPQPASSSRGRSAPQNKFLFLENEGGD